MDYDNFNIRVSQYDQIRRGWPVFVSSSAGERPGFMPDTLFRRDEIMRYRENFYKILESLRRQETYRVYLPPNEQFIRDVGKILFETLIQGRIYHLYIRSKQCAADKDHRLRLILHAAEVPELMILLWEWLFDPQEGKHLCLSRNISLVRYLELERTVPTLEVHGPIRVLVAGANPENSSKLKVTYEYECIKNAIRPLEAKGLVNLHFLREQTTIFQLEKALAEKEPWHIVHFICHGGFDRQRNEGFITLVGNYRGRGRHVFATDLASLFDGHEPRLVLLNSCNSGQGEIQDVFSNIASILTEKGIPAILAMLYGITDNAAVNFADKFYHELARGGPIDAAVTEARISLSLHHSNAPEWGTPVLYMRSNNSVLFRQTLAPPLLTPEPTPVQPKRHKGLPPLWLVATIAVTIVLLLGLVTEVFIARRPYTTTPPKQSTVTYNHALGGIGLSAYCLALHYEKDVEISGDEYCSGESSFKINMVQACDSQYAKNDLIAETSDPHNPNDWLCYDSQHHLMGDLPNLPKFCTSQGYTAAVPAGSQSDVWFCQRPPRQKIDITQACMSTYHLKNVQARKVNNLWVCYGPDVSG